MGALDDIEAALRARTGKRVYGTPFYEQKLAELEQAQQGRDIGNQQAALNLQQDTEKFPLELDALKAMTANRGASTELTGEKTKALEFQNSPEMRALVQQRAQADVEYKSGKTALDRIAAAQKAKLIDAQIEKLKAQTAHVGEVKPQRDRLQLKEGNNGEQTVVNLDEVYRQQQAAQAGNGAAAKPGIVSTGLQRPATAQEKNRRDQATIILGEVDNLLPQLDQLSKQLGPGAGNWNRLKDAVGMAPPAVREVRTKLKVIADLLPILHGFRGGTQIAQEFKNMVGDINQGPEQIKSSLRAVTQVADLIRRGASTQEIEYVISRTRVGAGNTPSTGVDPEVAKRLKALGVPGF